MAFFTDTAAAAGRPTLISSFKVRMADFAGRLAMAQNRTDTVEKLQALSDRELGDLGLARADIIRHVYRDIYYI